MDAVAFVLPRFSVCMKGGTDMAIAKLLPRKAAPTKTRAQSMTARHDYDSNPDKTREGELVSSYMCQPESAAAEFEASKLIYGFRRIHNIPVYNSGIPPKSLCILLQRDNPSAAP